MLLKGVESDRNKNGQVYLLCVRHLRSVNTLCITFPGEILDFLSFSGHLLVIFRQVSFFKKSFSFNQLVIVHVMENRNHRNC